MWCSLVVTVGYLVGGELYPALAMAHQVSRWIGLAGFIVLAWSWFFGGGIGILQCRGLNRRRGCIAIAALALALTGCKPSTRVDLHYLSGFVPGSQNIFRPAKIAVPPTTGSSAPAIPRSARSTMPTAARKLISRSATGFALSTRRLIKGLADAGLVPVALDSNPADGKPPEGSDFILTSELEQLEVNKRFEATQTIHGQYFTMKAVVRVKYQLRNRDGGSALLQRDQRRRKRTAKHRRRRGFSAAGNGTR